MTNEQRGMVHTGYIMWKSVKAEINMACSRNWQKTSVIEHKNIYSSFLETEIKTSNMKVYLSSSKTYSKNYFQGSFKASRKLQSIMSFSLILKTKNKTKNPPKTLSCISSLQKTKVTLIDLLLFSLYCFQLHNKNHNFLVLLWFLRRRL